MKLDLPTRDECNELWSESRNVQQATVLLTHVVRKSAEEGHKMRERSQVLKLPNVAGKWRINV